MKPFAYTLVALLAVLPAVHWISADCQTVSAGAETDVSTGSLQNAGQMVIGRTVGSGIYLHAGIIPCLAAAQCIQVAPDLDQDCDVDHDDWLLLEACAAGSAVPHSGTPTCLQADFDGDGDVDAADFATFQRCYSGPGNQPSPHCEG
jgi:hypothetical protein